LRERDSKLDDFTYRVNGKTLKLLEELPRAVAYPYTKVISLN